jgi:hypothetical protein
MAQDGGCEYSVELKVLSSEIGPNLKLYTQNFAERSVAHLRSSCVRAFGHESEPNGSSAVWTFTPNGLFVEHFVVVLLEPHELEALGTATHLR